ncbi:MAG: hypothetical protein JWP99_1224 [Devosia sp.]|nr:hypothetical protein [Devosia sp.]
MMLKTFGKLAVMVLLGAAPGGCIDADVDVQLTSDSTARATITQVMGADFYAMVKMNAEEMGEDLPEEDKFCAQGALTENDNGTATCVIKEQGSFSRLTMGTRGQTVQFAPGGPGLVRVSLPTDSMKSEIGADQAMDAETRQMVEAFFAGRGVTIRFGGLEVIDTNMKLSGDGQSAERKIMFLDLLRSKADLPAELYAVVRVPR